MFGLKSNLVNVMLSLQLSCGHNIQILDTVTVNKGGPVPFSFYVYVSRDFFSFADSLMTCTLR